jgi:hypothetical protein
MSVARNKLNDWLEYKLAESHETWKFCTEILEGLHSDRWTPSYRAMVMQYHRKPRYDFGDAYVFGMIHGYLHLGELQLVESRVGAIPVADARIEENNRLLKGLSGPLQAEFTGGLADCDGRVTVKGSKEDWVPLEVGDTDAATTFKHLLFHGGVARWPYGSDTMFIICGAEDWLEKAAL